MTIRTGRAAQYDRHHLEAEWENIDFLASSWGGSLTESQIAERLGMTTKVLRQKLAYRERCRLEAG